MPAVKLLLKMSTVAIVILFLQGCYCYSVQERDLIGHYSLRAKWGCGSLDIRADHTFTQKVAISCQGAQQTTEGAWSASDPAVSQITFKPFLDHDSEGYLKRYEYDDPSVEHILWSPLRIVINPDAGFSYEKQR